MKRAAFASLCFFLSFSLFSGCSPVTETNLLLFNDEMNRVSDIKAELKDYIITDNEYQRLIKKDENELLLSAAENEAGEIYQVRLSMAKADEKGKPLALTEQQLQFFRENAVSVLRAFTFREKEICESLSSRLLPLKSSSLSEVGEVTLDEGSFRLVYYSNKICCFFSVTNTLLRKTEATEKPVSRPLYGVTAKPDR